MLVIISYSFIMAKIKQKVENFDKMLLKGTTVFFFFVPPSVRVCMCVYSCVCKCACVGVLRCVSVGVCKHICWESMKIYQSRSRNFRTYIRSLKAPGQRLITQSDVLMHEKSVYKGGGIQEENCYRILEKSRHQN